MGSNNLKEYPKCPHCGTTMHGELTLPKIQSNDEQFKKNANDFLMLQDKLDGLKKEGQELQQKITMFKQDKDKIRNFFVKRLSRGHWKISGFDIKIYNNNKNISIERRKDNE